MGVTATGSTPALRPSLGCQGQHPKPTAECKVLFTPGSKCSSMLLLIQTFLHAPLKATGPAAAGEALDFPMRMCPFESPPQPGSACRDRADAQLTPLQAGLSPSRLAAEQQPLPALALLSPRWQSSPLLHTASPGCPQSPAVLPGGDRVGSPFLDGRPHSPSHPSSWGLWDWHYPMLIRASSRAALALSSLTKPQPDEIPS